LRERVRGSILGGAIGDALGAAFELIGSRRIEATLGSPAVREYHEALTRSLLFPRLPGLPTDDTAMTLALVRALCRPEGHRPEIVHRVMIDALRTEDSEFGKLFWRGGPGGACVAMIRRAQAGGGPFDGIEPNASGNGAAMRAHVCGVFPDRAYVFELAGMQARLSHRHPGAVAAAQTIALIVHEALYTGTFATELPPEITEPNMTAAWHRAHSGLERGERLPRHLRDADVAGWNTVATAHAIAQLYSDDLETAVGLAAGSGKDTDTVASMTGAMLGAVHGAAALPARWLEGLRQRGAIEGAAERLLAQL
jgi:ADP-ribosylglycohydrolase